MTAYEFGGGMDDDICPVFQRPQQIWSGKGGVHHQRNPVSMSYPCRFFQIDNAGIGIAQGFHKNRLGVFLYRCLHGPLFLRIHKCGRNA